ncbi:MULTISPECIES: hypothetical protein [Sphaerimonospora]|uniref:Uncharacterized protein n=2 Tax=Sphaerimonospora TaxID=1792303 RepID=A0A8J3RFI6_9ACTN|nr:hypothetical protein [Sphaerimonospora thailandensis]GIH71458.1 hypothetical protein Mth01_37110 [Sphaerimonospora thailandensis]
MPSIMERIRNYLNSQSGRQTRDKARTMTRDPHTRQRLRHFVDQWREQRHRR